MARFDFNRDGKKNIFDSMIEYEIYKDVMGEGDDTDNTPSYRKRKAHNSDDTAIWIILIILLIIPFIIFLKVGVNFLTAACWAWATINLLFWIIAPLVYKGSADTDNPDNIVFLISTVVFFIIGLMIMGIAGY